MEELSQTERLFESLRGKLTGHRENVQAEKEKTQRMLAETSAKIDTLKQQLVELERNVFTNHASMNQAVGLAYALKETVKELRRQETGEQDGGGVGELRILIEAEKVRAREFAVALVGESAYTDEFLKDPNSTIDEEKAGGLILEIKMTLRGTVTDRREKLSQATGNRVDRRDSEYEKKEGEYRDAETHYQNAIVDLSNAETRRDNLLEQIHHTLQTIRVLEEAIKKSDRVATRIEEQGRKHEKEDLTEAKQRYDDSKTAHEKAKAELVIREQHKLLSEGVVTEMIKAENRLSVTIEKFPAVLALYGRGVEVRSQIPNTGQRLVIMRGEFDRVVFEGIQGIDPAILRIGDGVHGKIYETLGYWKNEGENAFDALEKATERLTDLLKTLETSISSAGAYESDNLDWKDVESVFLAADELDRFLKNEWPNLKAGTFEGAEAIAAEAREELLKVLQPLAGLRRVCDEMKAVETSAAEALEASTPARRRGRGVREE